MTKVRAKNKSEKKEKAYTPEILIKAVDECINEETNCYKAAKKYDIPRSTINNYILNQNIGFKIGRPPQFSKAQEQLIVK